MKSAAKNHNQNLDQNLDQNSSDLSRSLHGEIFAEIEGIERKHISTGELEEAIARMRGLDEKYPGQYLIKVGLSEIFLIKGERAQCARLLFVAANLNPTDFRFDLLRRLLDFLNEGSAEKREGLAKKVARSGQAAVFYLAGLAEYLDRYGRRDDKIAILKLLTGIETDTESGRHLFHACLAVDLTDCALMVAKRLVAADPCDPAAHVSLAIVYDRQGSFEMAKASLDSAEALPGFIHNQFTRAIREK